MNSNLPKGTRIVNGIWFGTATILGLSTAYFFGNLGYGVYLEWPNIKEKREAHKQRLEEKKIQKIKEFLKEQEQQEQQQQQQSK
mmetsp:Transcript_12485/g.18864  ORF Transcript_12485/g.18864 Transcript_12485/m.18864 type:complete len:84 (+) Transcript_12485:44-295(+)